MLSPSERRDPVLPVVTLIVGINVVLTFLYGFGNVFTLALRLGVPVWVLVAVRSLSVRGAPVEVIRPARPLLLDSSV